MITSYEVYATRVAQFEASKEGDGLYAEQASVDVVACKRWVIRWKSDINAHQERGSLCLEHNHRF